MNIDPLETTFRTPPEPEGWRVDERRAEVGAGICCAAWLRDAPTLTDEQRRAAEARYVQFIEQRYGGPEAIDKAYQAHDESDPGTSEWCEAQRAATPHALLALDRVESANFDFQVFLEVN